MRVLAELQCTPAGLPTAVIVRAGEALNGFSLGTPSTTERCQAALAAAVDSMGEGDGAGCDAAAPLPTAYK